MIDFVYTKDRLPDAHAMCVIWVKKRDKKTGEEYVCLNTHLAMFDYRTVVDGMNVWRFADTNEICNNQDVVKYIEIPARQWTKLTKKGKIRYRLKDLFHGLKYCKFEED